MLFLILLVTFLLIVFVYRQPHPSLQSTQSPMHILEFGEHDRMIVDDKTYQTAMANWECMQPGPIDVTHLNNPMRIDFSRERSLARRFRAQWTISQTELVNKAIPLLNKQRMQTTLADLMAFHNRHAFNPTAKEASTYLQNKVQNLFNNAKHAIKTNVQLFPHTFTESGITPNPSVIARIEGSTSSQDIVIVCSHMDSINHSMVDPSAKRTAKAPGGDDNGSGTVCNLDLLTAWLDAKITPTKTIEFHWYAGEELGLKGSLEVAQSYRTQSKKVIAVCNADMTGFSNAANNVYLIADKSEADPDLAEFMSQIVKKYTKLTPMKTKCGYGCSDHTSWFKFGYPAVAISEGSPAIANSMTPYIHTSNDTDKNLNYDYMLQCAAAMLAFSIETAA